MWMPSKGLIKGRFLKLVPHLGISVLVPYQKVENTDYKNNCHQRFPSIAPTNHAYPALVHEGQARLWYKLGR